MGGVAYEAIIDDGRGGRQPFKLVGGEYILSFVYGLPMSQVALPFNDEEELVELTPPLKWAGGKRWLVPRLREMYAQHRHRRLVEPFTGGLAVALGLQPEDALLGDVNPHVISFYRWLQRGLRVRFPMENGMRSYYRMRERFNELVCFGKARSAEAAGLFYYLNRTGYNGLCRFNKRGLFNVPFGKYTSISYKTSFLAYRALLSRWSFMCKDFELLPIERDDFIYSDPPFDVEFTQYSKDDFTWEDQVRHARWLAKHDGPVVASNQATPRILELYSELGFSIEIVSGPRRISCTGDRKPAQELLATRRL